MPKKSIRGRGWTPTELESLLDSIQEVLPIGMNEWDAVLAQHRSRYPDTYRKRDGIKRKFASLYNTKTLPGDPIFSPIIRRAKQLHNQIKAKVVPQPEEKEKEEQVEDLQAELSDISDSVSSVTFSAQKRRAETVHIRTPRRRRGGGIMDDMKDYWPLFLLQENGIDNYFQFMILKQLEEEREEMMELEERMERMEERRRKEMMEFEKRRRKEMMKERMKRMELEKRMERMEERRRKEMMEFEERRRKET